MSVLLPSTTITSDTILVTGGAGFIGSHVCEHLLSHYLECNVVVVDNCNAHYTKKIKQNRVAQLKKKYSRRFVFKAGSVTQPGFISQVLSEVKPTYVLHLAAEVGVRKGELKQANYFKTNVLGTTLVLDALPSSVKHVVVASSSAVYGNTQVPFSERTVLGPQTPLSVYGGSKLAMESAAFQFYRKSTIPLSIIRPFSVYGPDGRPDMFPLILAKAALNSSTVKIFGDPAKLHRDWTYIDDMVAGIAAILVRPRTFSVVNFGRGKSISMKEVLKVAQTLFKAHNLELKFEVIQRNMIEMEKTWADISVARKLYGYQPKTDFKKGYQQVVDFVMAHKDRYTR